MFFNEDPLQNHVFLQKRHSDKTSHFHLPFSTIVQRSTRNMKDIGKVEHPPITLHTMDVDHFSQLLPHLKPGKMIIVVKPIETQVPLHHQHQVKRNSMDFEKYPNLPFSTLVRHME
jgi:hypothetical protein